MAVKGFGERVERIAVNGFRERIDRIRQGAGVNQPGWAGLRLCSRDFQSPVHGEERIAVNGFGERIERIAVNGFGSGLTGFVRVLA